MDSLALNVMQWYDWWCAIEHFSNNGRVWFQSHTVSLYCRQTVLTPTPLFMLGQPGCMCEYSYIAMIERASLICTVPKYYRQTKHMFVCEVAIRVQSSYKVAYWQTAMLRNV